MKAAGWSETQSPRMWLSAAGAVSPLHYDHSVSVLAQVHGVKRMLLYPPSTLSRAHLYPNWHPLRRRARVQLDSRMSREEAAAVWPRWIGGGGGGGGLHAQIVRGDGAVAAAAEEEEESKRDASEDTSRRRGGNLVAGEPPGAWEAVLGPGDVLVFPPRWAHYTESLGPNLSASVTRRFLARRRKHPPPAPRSPAAPGGVTPESLESARRFARRGTGGVGWEGCTPRTVVIRHSSFVIRQSSFVFSCSVLSPSRTCPLCSRRADCISRPHHREKRGVNTCSTVMTITVIAMMTTDCVPRFFLYELAR